MLPFKRILFPIDYSPRCEAIVPYVADAVRRFSAQLTLLHAYMSEALALTDLPLSDPKLVEVVQCKEQERMQSFAKANFPAEHVETVVELGETGSVIHKAVERNGTDLVMLPTHGRGPVRRLLLGSVTAKALHDLDAAVWTSAGSHSEAYTPRLPYRSILCAVDESGEAEAVVKAAATLADVYQADLRLVHVVERPVNSVEVDFTPYLKDLMDAADFNLRELKGRLGIDAPHSVIEGVPSFDIGREAIHRKADLIVAGRGRIQNTIARLWAHLYGIVRESPCPVISI